MQQKNLSDQDHALVFGPCLCAQCSPQFHVAHMAGKRKAKAVKDAEVAEQRFLASSQGTNDFGCKLWTGTLTKQGYGVFQAFGKQQIAHRYALERTGFPLRSELTVDHLCSVRACVNIAHLEVVDSATNSLRSTNPLANNARKIFPDCGHVFDRTDKRGWRSCGACAKERDALRQRAYRAQRAQRPPIEN